MIKFSIKQRQKMLAAVFFTVCLNSHFAMANKGLEISIEADKRDTGFENVTAEMTMLLKNRHGESSSRHMVNKTLEGQGDGDKTLIIFRQPLDVKGTALLTFTHKRKADDQWLYLPELKRVKRISSRNKSGPFMGSEFAYEDFSSQEIEKYTYQYLKDEVVDGQDCYLIERYPTDKYSGYTRQHVWIDKVKYQPIKIDFYDRKKSLLKTLTFSDYKLYIDKFWRADVLYMVNHQNGKSTRISWKNYQFKTKLTDRDFTKNSLKRAR